MEQVEQYPVMSQVAPGAIRGQLPAAPPVQGEPFEAMLRDVNEYSTRYHALAVAEFFRVLSGE